MSERSSVVKNDSTPFTGRRGSDGIGRVDHDLAREPATRLTHHVLGAGPLDCQDDQFAEGCGIGDRCDTAASGFSPLRELAGVPCAEPDGMTMPDESLTERPGHYAGAKNADVHLWCSSVTGPPSRP
jgi:hypothetical protein